ncbi:MAG TPA: hypothetical protein VMV18_00045 [bacterium]|nr:hypothetical protein [bacterium]
MFRFGPRLIARWTGIVTFACVIGGLLATWIASRTFAHAFDGFYPRFEVLAIGMAAAGLAHGAVMGAAERLVLEKVLARRIRFFVVLSAVAAAMAWPVWILASASAFDAELPRVAAYLLATGFALAVGALIGVSQWLALREALPHGAMWIPVNALAFAAGTGTAIGVFQLIDGLVGAREVAPFVMPLFVGVAAACGGLAVGVVTGISLMGLGKWTVTPRERFPVTP